MKELFNKQSFFAVCVSILAVTLGISGYDIVFDEDVQTEYLSFSQASDIAKERGFLYHWEVSGDVALSSNIEIHCREDDCSYEAVSVSYYGVVDTIQTGSKFDNPEQLLHKVKLPIGMNKYFLIGHWFNHKFRFIKREEIKF